MAYDTTDDRRRNMIKKEREEHAAQLRAARKRASKAAKEATLAANKSSATFPHPVALYVAPLADAGVATAVAFVDGRIGSKEDVTSWVTAGIGLLGTIGGVLMGAPTIALGFSTLFTGGLSSTGTRRARAQGEKMRAEAGAH